MGTNVREVESRVTSVTIYQGRAMVTRSVQVELPAGEHRLVFGGLPAEVDRDSIQVKGRGEAILGDCSFDTEFTIEDVSQRVRDLAASKEKLEDSLSESKMLSDAAAKECEFVERIAAFVTTREQVPASAGATGEGRELELDPGNWLKLTSFYRERLSALSAESRKAALVQRELSRELDRNARELASLGAGRKKSRNIIKVSLSMAAQGSLSLDLSYVVNGPSWRPVYDLRASSEKGLVSVEMHAYVRQTTAEDWKGVELKLSTAKVGVSGVLPELEPWNLQIFRPAPAGASRRAAMPMMAKMAEMAPPAPCCMTGAGAAEDDLMRPPEAEPEMAAPDADVETGGASVVFGVAGGGNVGSDGKDSRVTLMRKELPVEMTHAATPKLSEFAYLRGKLKNGTDFPFLPGKANVFMDGSFVSVSELPLTMPGQEIDLSLGVDEAVKVERRQLKRFFKDEGIISKRSYEQFDFQIRVTNNRKDAVSMKVFDQFPVPSSQEITVKRIAPAVKEGSKDPILDDEAKLEWNFRLEPGEKREIALSFTVDYPKGSRIPNL